MTRALRLQLARDFRATADADASTRSPLFNLICNKVSVGFSLVQLAQMLVELNKAEAEDARNVCERVYSQAMLYAQQLPDNEQPSALFKLGRLRVALDQLTSGSEPQT